MLPAGHVIEEHNLNVGLAGVLEFDSLGEVAGLGEGGVDVDELAVALVPKHEALLAGGVRAEVGRVVVAGGLGVEAEVGEVAGARHQDRVLQEHLLHVVRLHSVRQVDVTAHLAALLVVRDAADEQDRGQTPVSERGFPVCQRLEEGVSVDGALLAGQLLDVLHLLLALALLVGLLLGLKLLARQRLALAVVAVLDELTGQVLVL